MIAELKSYRAVSCVCCHEAIPVSLNVATLEVEIKHEKTRTGPRAFAARCKACNYEGIYAITDIRAVDGEPRSRSLKRAACVS